MIGLVELKVKDIVKSAMGTEIFGVSLVEPKKITIEFVEKQFLPILNLLDKNLAQFNEHTDRRFDKLLYDMYPSLRPDVEIENDDFVNIKRIPVLIAVLWHEMLSSLLSTLEVLGDKHVKKSNNHHECHKRVIWITIEHLKALFYCQIDGIRRGLSIKALEEISLYYKVKELVESY